MILDFILDCVEWLIDHIIWVIVVLVLLTITYLTYNTIVHPCIRSHKEWVKHYPAPIYIQIGNVWIPILKPPYTSWDTVCDERK